MRESGYPATSLKPLSCSANIDFESGNHWVRVMFSMTNAAVLIRYAVDFSPFSGESVQVKKVHEISRDLYEYQRRIINEGLDHSAKHADPADKEAP